MKYIKQFIVFAIVAGAISIPLSMYFVGETFKGALLLYLISTPITAAILIYFNYLREKRLTKTGE